MSKLNFNKIAFFAAYGTSSQIPASTLPEIVIAGKSNVGKSSLINKICSNNKIAKVSSTPGKTTTINFFKLDKTMLVDLPGYGFSKKSKVEMQRWQELIEGYFSQDRNFALTILLLDIRHDPTNHDISMLNYICNLGLPFIVCLTKADKLSKQKANNAKRKIEKLINSEKHLQIIASSAHNGQGLNEIKNCIELALN